MNRYLSHHKTALAIGTPDELRIIRMVFEVEPHLLLSDATSAMIPVAAAHERMEMLTPELFSQADVPVFVTLFTFISEQKADGVDWIVLSARAR